MPETIAIYRDRLLSFSETFVVEQAEKFRRYRPVYLGSRRVAGLALPEERTFVANARGIWGRLHEAGFKWRGSSWRMETNVRREEPKLIHAHFADDGAIVLPLARRLDIPLIVSLHGYDVTMSEEALQQGTAVRRRYLARRAPLKEQAALFLAVSNFIREKALANGFPSERTRVHYTGVDTEYFAPDPTVVRERKVLFVGRLVEKKGCTYLLQAMRRVAARWPDTEVIICGEGPLRGRLEAEARDVPCKVSFVGVRDRVGVRQLMRTARVLCVPSTLAATGDAEGFGMIFVEAQAVGLPVVSFATGGVPEAVADGETGLLVPDRDTAALSEALERLLADEVLWKRFSAQGREYVLANFDLARQCMQLEAIYDEVVRARHHGPPSSEAIGITRA